MRPDQREEAEAALFALEKDEPWMDDGSLTGRRWESEGAMAQQVEAVKARIGGVAALAAQELVQAGRMLDETNKKLQAEISMRTELVEACKALHGLV